MDSRGCLLESSRQGDGDNDGTYTIRTIRKGLLALCSRDVSNSFVPKWEYLRRLFLRTSGGVRLLSSVNSTGSEALVRFLGRHIATRVKMRL